MFQFSGDAAFTEVRIPRILLSGNAYRYAIDAIIDEDFAMFARREPLFEFEFDDALFAFA